MKRAVLGLVGLLLVATCAPVPAAAAGGWDFSIAPYLWGAGIDGTVNVRGHQADVDMAFEDILDDLEFGAMVNLQARKDRLGFYGDFLVLSLSDENDVYSPSGVRLLGVETEVEQWLVDFGVSWELTRWVACGETTGYVDLIVGGRYWDVETELKSDQPVFSGSDEIERYTDWIDLIVGARFATALTPKLSLVGRADVGGFDIADGSELTWSASAYLGWRFTPMITGWAGWKYLSVEREDDEDNEIDLALSGPVLGISFTF